MKKLLCILIFVMFGSFIAQAQELIRTFSGHTKGVLSVCFSPDGKMALSGSLDNTLKLWGIGTGQVIRTFSGHTKYVLSVCFSPDGKMVLSGSSDNTLKLWSIETGQVIRTFSEHTEGVHSVCFSPDGKTALSGSDALKLWNIATGQVIRTFSWSNFIRSVSFSPNGKIALASGDLSELFKIWDIATGKEIHIFSGHKSPNPSQLGNAVTVCFSPDGKTILSGNEGELSLKLWKMLSAEEIAQSLKTKATIATNSNKALWKMSNNLCKETSDGIVVVQLNAWNEDKSMVHVKVITSPGGYLGGESLTKGNTFWVSASGQGWHLCLGEEVQKSLSEDRSSPKTTTIIKAPEDKSCYTCGGRGSCVKCNGKGYTPCDYHDTNKDGNCTTCENRGILNCYTCRSSGSCSSCGGTGKR